MTITPIGDVGFDDAATLAMGEAFDRACKSLRNLGSAVPEIIAYLIIKAAKTGERDPARLYEQVLNAFSIDDMSMPVVSVGSDLPVPAYASARKQRDLKRARLDPDPAGLLLSFSGASSNCRPFGI
jgi:hypothetical protein